jgi:small subunit ribosomal protein S6
LAENVYEALFIFDSTRYNRDTEGVSRQVPALIEKLGGEILVSRLWEERRLAYSLKGQRKGTYWLLYFRLDRQQLAEVRRQCAINENILRVLFLKVDPRIVDALVSHAKSAVTTAATAEGAAPAEAPAAVAVLDEHAKEGGEKEDRRGKKG